MVNSAIFDFDFVKLYKNEKNALSPYSNLLFLKKR